MPLFSSLASAGNYDRHGPTGCQWEDKVPLQGLTQCPTSMHHLLETNLSPACEVRLALPRGAHHLDYEESCFDLEECFSHKFPA